MNTLIHNQEDDMGFVLGLVAAIVAAVGVRHGLRGFPFSDTAIAFLASPLGFAVQTTIYTVIELTTFILVSRRGLALTAFLIALAASLSLRAVIAIDSTGVIAMFVYHLPWFGHALTAVLTSLVIIVYAAIAKATQEKQATA